MATAMEASLFQFSAAKTLAEVQALNEAARMCKSFEEFKGKAEGICEKLNERYLTTEYNTAVLAAESAANYTRMIRQAEKLPYWKYKTTGDDQVREEHAALNGLVLPYNDPAWDSIFPPNGWSCRCTVIAIPKGPENDGFELNKARADNYMQTPSYKSAKLSGWGDNRGKSWVVFDKNQQYVSKFKEGDFLDKMTAEKWGQPTVAELMAKASGAAPVTEASAAEVWQASSVEGKYIPVMDYKNRTAIINKKGFDAHTIGKSDNRINLWDAMKDTLKSPDEVWLQGERLKDYTGWLKGIEKDRLFDDTYSVIKYYSNKAIVVNYKVKDHVLELRTWYELALRLNVVNRKRSGLLIKKAAK